MTRLQAEEQLAHVQALGVGTGSYGKEDQRRYLRTWEQTAAPDRRAAVVKLQPGDARTIGIAVTRVKRRKAG